MMNTYKELTVWIAEHQIQFNHDKYTVDDIFKLALACGFDQSAVVQWRTQQMFRKVA